MAALFFLLLILFNLFSPIFCTSRPLSSEEKTNIDGSDFLIIKMKTSSNNNNDDLIENTCKNTPNYQLCISTLQSDPKSNGADVAGLGLIMVDAIKSKAISTVETINQLRRSYPEYSLPLFECSILYNAILKADVPVAVDGLRKGVPKFAENGMDDAVVEVRGCEESFKQSNVVVVPRLSNLNHDVYELSVVAKSIIRLLL